LERFISASVSAITLNNCLPRSEALLIRVAIMSVFVQTDHAEHSEIPYEALSFIY